MQSYIFNFSDELNFDSERQKKLLGNKSYNLSSMYKIGLPIPSGFTITTELCEYYYKNNSQFPTNLREGLKKNIDLLQEQSGKIFGDQSPLLLSVRSGSVVSMPGMMDTILNLGLNEKIVEYFAKDSTNPSFAYDCYIRFIEMFSSIALEMNHTILLKVKNDLLSQYDIESSKAIENLEFQKILVKKYKSTLADRKIEFPDEPEQQLLLAIEAVIKSWNSQRAKIYRKLHNISDKIGTAVTVQSMVFGNFNVNSCTGVIFSRNPSDGKDEIFGEYIIQAQGEDIVSGKKTPLPIKNHLNSMESVMPEQYLKLTTYCNLIEKKYKDAQDIEFTVESGKLFILQARSAKRTVKASIKILYDLVKEGLISKQEALLRIDTSQLNQLLHPTIVKNPDLKELAIGLPASPGAATGKVVFCSEMAEIYAKDHEVILLRNDTCPEDIKGMSLATGIITSRGGLTSHAAVVARGMGKPCVCGVASLNIDMDKKIARIGDIIIKEFDTLSIDGSSGEIFLGDVKVVAASIPSEFAEILNWANDFKIMHVRANAETVKDVEAAINFGAEGIGLCRTEHMFFDTEKISLVRQMIISQSYNDRAKILEKILPLHTKDFIDIFHIMKGLPINIRLLDPPLHEFLPKTRADIDELAHTMNLDQEFIKCQLERLSETNPMLGHRGARLGVTHPDIYEMQIKAIITAAIKVKKENIPLNIEIMLPLISSEAELIHLKTLVMQEAENVMIKYGESIDFKIGTMIELPRAAMVAEKLAKHVDFFSFGTNDLTQTVYGISRDDISNFLPEYKAASIFTTDPFTSIDREGVGEVISIALKKGRNINPTLTSGICGEHGGDPESIKFFHEQKLDYISCSPYRIPAARICAAQAALLDK